MVSAKGVVSGGSGSHRGNHESFANAFHGHALNMAEMTLESCDTIQLLLSIAAGDFSSVGVEGTVATAADVASAASIRGSPAGDGPIQTTSPSMMSLSLSNATMPKGSGGGGGGLDTRPTTGASIMFPSRHSSSHSSGSPMVRETRIGSEGFRGHAETDGRVLTDAEASTFYLTAMVAQVLHREDYWVHLGHQIEVDQHVEFLQYCAREGFGALKALHLLGWWRQYRELVRGGEGLLESSSFVALELSDGSPQKAELASPSRGGGGEQTTLGAAGASAHGREGAGGGSVKSVRKGRRLSASMVSTAAPPNEEEEVENLVADSTTFYASYTDALIGELERFVKWELEHEWAWRQVPRQPVVNVGGGGVTPRTTSVGGGSRRSNATNPVSSAGVAKASRADKAKLQQQQQQEMEAEEQRLARVAALPPDNIFLSKDDVDSFVRFAVTEDLLTHTALHTYVASHSQQPASTLSRSAKGPVCFSVSVEVPMPVPPLREATRLSALPHGSGSYDATAASSPMPRDGTVEAAGGSGGTAAQGQPIRPSSGTSGARGKQGGARARIQSKNGTRDAAAAQDAAAAVTSTASETVAAPLTAMAALRAAQQKEATAYRLAYDEAQAHAAMQQQATQHAVDVQLYFENPHRNDAVTAVYVSIEDAVAERQQRILQRVVALERALGLEPLTSEGEKSDITGSGQGGGGSAAVSKGANGRGNGSSAPSSTTAKKGK